MNRAQFKDVATTSNNALANTCVNSLPEDQDRSVVHSRPGRRARRPGDHRCSRRSWRQPRQDGGRRGHRDGRADEAGQGPWLPRRTRPFLRRTHARRNHPRTAGRLDERRTAGCLSPSGHPQLAGRPAPSHIQQRCLRSTLTIIPADHDQPRRRRDRHERRRAIPRAAPVLLAAAHSGRRAADGHPRHIPFLVGHRCAPLSLVKH